MNHPCPRCKVRERLSHSPYCLQCRHEYRDSRRTKPKKFIRRPNRADGLCPECGIRPKQKYHGYCRRCANKKHALWIRSKGGQWAYAIARGNHHKMVARRYVMTMLQRGHITREPCEVCGKLKVQAHHDDYSNPLDIRWLCREHHVALERWIRMKRKKLLTVSQGTV